MSSPNPAAGTTMRCSPDQGFLAWIAGAGGTLAITTYQAGSLLFVGWNGRQMSLLPRHFDKPMGLDARDGQMALATRHAVHLLADAKPLAHNYRDLGHYDSIYLPRVSYHTPELNIHDVAIGADAVWLVVTRLNCLARPSALHTVEPVWRPPFIGALVFEDRCHLNGLAMRDGQPAFVTCLGTADSAGGWREGKKSGGIVMDIATNEIVLRGLAMPHSPRWHDGRLWLLNSGAGELLRLDPKTFAPEVVCTLPGYLRGLTFVGRHALVGMCKIREEHIFGGMPVQEKFKELFCAVAVIDTADGREVGRLHFTEGISELFDLRFLRGVRQGNILGPDKEEIHTAVAVPDCYYWLRPKVEGKKE